MDQDKLLRWGEADVREEIAAPILRRLGYGAGQQHSIVRELTLRYPRAYVGRAKPASDPPLRGRADYICAADGRVRWVLEAKAPTVMMAATDDDQAFSYAAHPEVRAVYYCVTNGREFVVRRTSDAPGAEPADRIDLRDADAAFNRLSAWLSPAAVLRAFPTAAAPAGPPIAAGFRSIMKIVNGSVTYEHPSRHPPLHGMIASIEDGTIERDDEGYVVGFLRVRAPHEALHQLNRRLGLDENVFTTTATEVSTDQAAPTVFTSSQRIVLPRGERLLDMRTWQIIALPIDVACEVATRGTCCVAEGIGRGRFAVTTTFPSMKVTQQFGGHFEFGAT